jgi:hypothetical protein
MRRMVVKVLRNLRTKPASVRERYALGIAGSITGVIALIWMLALPGSPEESARRIAEQEQVARPFAALANGVGEQLASVRDSLNASQAAYEDEAQIAGATVESPENPDRVADGHRANPRNSQTVM